MSLALFALGSFVSTFCGGLFALKHARNLHYILSFTAGVLLGVVSFDILPEIFELSAAHGLDPVRAMVALVGGFLFFHTLEKFILLHHAHEHTYAAHRHPDVGVFSALALIGHSFLDGVGIGLAFQVSDGVGIAVGIAVIAHDLCDGLNTVGLMLVSHNTRRKALAMLTLDALAPVLGAASTLAFRLPPGALVLFLGFFAGFLLYISAADILPEAHSQAPPHRTLRLVTLTALGAAFLFAVVRVAG